VSGHRSRRAPLAAGRDLHICRNVASLLQRSVLLVLVLCLGCDQDGPPVTDENLSISDETPILPGVPWFELPGDWSEQHPLVSPNAKLESHWMAMAEKLMPLHAGDGGGRAWLKSVRSIPLRELEWSHEPPTNERAPQQKRPALANERAPQQKRPALAVGSRHQFEVIFEVGPEGIQEGGLLFLSAEPFWEWSKAQATRQAADGFTTARLLSNGAELLPLDVGAGFEVRGGDLLPGERIEFIYGAGETGARVDRYAERNAEILIAVDADGDGMRGWIDDTPRLDIIARSGSRLVAFGPAEIAPNQPFEISVSITDTLGNRAAWPNKFREAGNLDDSGAEFELVVLDQSTLGLQQSKTFIIPPASIELPWILRCHPSPGTGTLRLQMRGRGVLEGLASDLPPIVVRESDTRLVWGDLHGHTTLSDGTGTPEDYLAYARDVARLDVIALTDHDHWGPRPLDDDPLAVSELFEIIDDAERAGRFVTLPGYEWTNWIHGHRHVLYFDEADDETASRKIFSALDPETDRPDELWSALRGRRALTFAHHSAGEPVAVNWAYAPDPELEPITEIASVHGQSESAYVKGAVRGGIPGYFVLDTLMQGYRFGFIGSGDSHDGHPGLAHLAAGQGGLAGIFTTELDRANILSALRKRQTFATNGIRPWLEVFIDGSRMGQTIVEPEHESSQRIRISYEATAPLERIEIVRSGRVATVLIPEEDALSLTIEREIPSLSAGDFHYVRFVERGGGMAWSSPIYVDPR